MRRTLQLLNRPLLSRNTPAAIKTTTYKNLAGFIRSSVLLEQNIATELGLIQYGQGFNHPVTIRFDDGAPAINENPYFYVPALLRPQGFQPATVRQCGGFCPPP